MAGSDSSSEAPIRARWLGRQDYATVFDAQRRFTAERDAGTADELWLLEHPPVFTQGQAGRPEHLLVPGEIPVVQSDRGGQVTYHGPGQLVLYLLLDCRRLGLGPRALVSAIEDSVVDLLAQWGVEGAARSDAPGVYVDGAKVAALGLRIRRGCSYHGLSLNVDGDLEPFARIDPCGMAGLQVTRLSDLGIGIDVRAAGAALLPHLCQRLGRDVPRLEESGLPARS